MEQITCDLIPGGKMPLLHASQYDEGREYRINLTENKQAYTLDGTELLTVSVRKGDNTLFTADIANTFGGKSYVDFVSTEQMCAVAGYNYGELTIERNNTRIGTVNFMLVCEPSPEASGLTSESEINNLNRQIDDYLDETLPDVLDDDVPPIVERVIDETLAPVAKSGNYNDLENKPTIPAAQVNSDWNADSGVSQILNKPNLATVATSGDYNDLLNKPSVAVIDDTQASANKVYSSNKIDNLLGKKANVSEVYNKNEINNTFDIFGTVKAEVANVSITPITGQAVYNKADYANNGNVTSSTNGAYCVVPVTAGEAYLVTTRSGGYYSAVAFFNSSTISKDNYLSTPDFQSSYTTLTDYMVIVPSGATYMTINTLNYSEYPISLKKIISTKTVEALYQAGYAFQSQVDDIVANKSKFEICMKVGDANVESGKYMDGRQIKTGEVNYALTDYFEIKTGDNFLLNFVYKITLFNANKEYRSEILVKDLANYSGSGRWNSWMATTNGYVRFSINNTTSPHWGAAIKFTDTSPYKIVSLGDSLFGNNQKPYDLTTYIQNATNLKSANCAFGGTRASATTVAQYKPLCFCNIADAIHDNDWSAIDIDWSSLYGDTVFMVNKDILIHIDWNEVQAITVCFGTNDMNGSIPIDNPLDPYDKETYKGGLRYGIEKILEAYPQITIVLLTPLYRYRPVGDDYSQIAYDSDTGDGLGGFIMQPYLEALQEVAEEYHLPCFDLYNGVGLNKITAISWLRDGTHLNYTIAPTKIGSVVGEDVALIVNSNRPKE